MKKTNAAWLSLLFLLCVPAWAPLAAPDWLQTHQGYLPLYHLDDLAQHGAQGWTPALSAPSDLWRGEGPLPYLLALPLRSFGNVVALKLVTGAALGLGPLALFLALRRLASAPAACAAALLWAFQPFTLTALYRRGAIGETLLLALLPALAWALLRLTDRPSAGRGLLTLLLAAAAFWTQAGLALLGLLLLGLWPLASDAAPRTRRLAWLSLGLAGLLGLASRAAWRSAAAPPSFPFADHAIYVFQLLDLADGFGLSQVGWQDDLSLGLGLIGLAFALFAWLPLRPLAAQQRRWRLVWTAAAVALTAAALLPLPLGALLTYPWQILGLAGLALSALAAAGLARRRSLQNWPALGLCVALIALSAQHNLTVRPAPVPPQPAPLAILGDAANTIVLADMTVAGALQAGRTVSVTLTWQALQAPDFDFNLYLHLLDDGGQRWGQTDIQPVADRPMTQWQVGEVLTATVPLAISADAPTPQRLRLEAGLYNWQSGVRLSPLTPFR